MKTLFLSPSLSRNMGGIFEISRSLAMSLLRERVSIEAVGLADQEWENDRSQWGEVPCSVFPSSVSRSFGLSFGLTRGVMDSDADLLHLHSLWLYTSILALSWGTIKKRPYLVTPNGMLEPWALRHSGLKKRVAALLYEKQMLQGAACLQANTLKEAEDFRSFGIKTPICIIPNGVELPELSQNSECGNQKLKSEKKILLYLGRIHPKKGLSDALKAFATVKAAGWQFIIAGWDQGGHETELRKLCEYLGLRVSDALDDADVYFMGPVYGESKKILLRRADAFILPSLSEGMPMAVLEAWAYGLPVLMTPECNLKEGFAVGAAIKIETNSELISKGLRELFAMRSAELKDMGCRGRCLVADRYTWKSIAIQMKAVYKWILEGNSEPDCLIK